LPEGRKALVWNKMGWDCRLLYKIRDMFHSSKFYLSICFLVLLSSLAACSKNKSGSGDGTETGVLSEEDLALQNARFGEGSIPKAMEDGPFKDVHFEFNSAQIGEEYLSNLQGYARTTKADPSLRVEIEGHTDKRGTTEYNMALGQRRAKAVAAAMTSFGVPASQMTIVSYGEEIPLDPSDSEEAYAQNRRAHFAVYRSGAK
jgi:peptidoglycan-associated lipoprotein